MNYLKNFMVVLFIMIFASCGADSKEKVINDYVKLFDEVISVMAVLEDKSSVEDSIPKFQKIQKKLDSLNERAKNLFMTEQDFTSNKIYVAKATESLESMAAAFSRLDDPETARAFREGISKVLIKHAVDSNISSIELCKRSCIKEMTDNFKIEGTIFKSKNHKSLNEMAKRCAACVEECEKKSN